MAWSYIRMAGDVDYNKRPGNVLVSVFRSINAVDIALMLIAMIWFAFVLILASEPRHTRFYGFSRHANDAAIHILIHGIIAAWVYIALRKFPMLNIVLVRALALLVSASVGAGIESVQFMFLGSRTFEYQDLQADIIGAATAGIIMVLAEAGGMTRSILAMFTGAAALSSIVVLIAISRHW